MSTFVRNADGRVCAATTSARFQPDVDEGIRDLLEALWSRGMATEFSCQGEQGELAHICFTNAGDACRFTQGRGDLLITLGESRAWVDFPPHLIGELTRFWSS
jgi:hypothetical protein